MSARTPEELCSQFTQRFSTGDIDALVALYEPDAVLLPQPGHVARGRAAIRESLAAFLAMRGTFRMTPPKVIHADGVALMVADWTLDAKAPDGSPLHLTRKVGSDSTIRDPAPVASAAVPSAGGQRVDP